MARLTFLRRHSTTRNTAALAAAALAVLMLLALAWAGVTWRGSEAASAATGGPEMVLNTKGGTCDDPVRPTECDVGYGFPFYISVDALGIPAAGYIGMQTYIDYGAALIYKPAASQVEEVMWPDADPATIAIDDSTPGHVYHVALTSLLSPPVSTYTGKLVAVEFNCPDASTTALVDLLPYDDPVAVGNGSAFLEAGTSQVITPKVSSLTINCVTAPTPEFTVTPKQPQTPTPTPTPTTEPTPLEEASETVSAASGGTVTTSAGDVLTVPADALLEDAEITVQVWDSDVIPAPTEDGVFLSRSYFFEPEGLEFEISATFTLTYDESEVTGIDEETMDVIVYDSVAEEWTVAEVLNRDTEANTITVSMPHFSPRMICRGDDCDLDGCINVSEEGADETSGGLRNMVNKNDFYDVAGPSAGPPDRTIDLFNDILGVINHFAPSGTEPEYDVHYDRGPSAGPNAWNMTAPDGVINLFVDILGVIAQYAHDCR